MINRLIFIGISLFLLTCNKAVKETETQVSEISKDTTGIQGETKFNHIIFKNQKNDTYI